MKFAKNILLTVCFAGLALAQSKNASAGKAMPVKPAAASGPVAIPKDAVEVEPGLFQAKDAGGKTWHYTRTPFGVRKFEPQNRQDTTVTEAARITVAGETADSIRFERKTPWGAAKWTKKKDQLNASEKLAVERAAAPPAKDTATAAAAKQ